MKPESSIPWLRNALFLFVLIAFSRPVSANKAIFIWGDTADPGYDSGSLGLSDLAHAYRRLVDENRYSPEDVIVVASTDETMELVDGYWKWSLYEYDGITIDYPLNVDGILTAMEDVEAIVADNETVIIFIQTHGDDMGDFDLAPGDDGLTYVLTDTELLSFDPLGALALRLGVNASGEKLLALTPASLRRFEIGANPYLPTERNRVAISGWAYPEMRVDGPWTYLDGIVGTQTVEDAAAGLIKRGAHDLRDWVEGRIVRDGVAERVAPGCANAYEVWEVAP